MQGGMGLNWKNRLRGKMDTPKEESTEVLEQRRMDLTTKAGNYQFNKAVIEAELLQMNQQILEINNTLGKRRQEAVGKPKEEALKVVDPKDIKVVTSPGLDTQAAIPA
jgi:hypothetical protein